MRASPLLGILKASLICMSLCLLESHAATAIARPLSDSEILSILTERIDVEKQGVAIVVGIIDGQGTRVISHGYANKQMQVAADTDSVFEIGSVTKVFTSLILADMVEKGEVKLTDPVAMYLPKSVTVPSRNGRQITLFDLATHRSGLPRMPANFAPKNPANPYADYTVEQMYAFLSGYSLTRDIGETVEYSNLAVGLLGHALALRAGTDYETLVRTRVTAPLGMKNTSIKLNPAMQARLAIGYTSVGEPVANWDMPTFAGTGALRSSMNDMLKFLAANMGANIGAKNTPLKNAIVGMHLPLAAIRNVSLGWGHSKKYGSEIISKDGATGGYNTFVGFDKTGGKGVVVLSNSTINVADIGHKVLNSEWRLMQLTPPKIYVRELDQRGYDQAISIYEEFKRNDSDFHLREEIANEWGYGLIADGKMKQGIDILKLGVYMRPTSANTYDSLAEAYEKNSDTVLAIVNYKKSLELEPKNLHAAERLNALASNKNASDLN